MAFRSISTTATPAAPLVITPPAGIVNDDILVFWCILDSNTPGTVTYPTGFAALTGTPINVTADGGFLYVATKKAASEAGNYTWSDTSARAAIGGVGAWSGRDPTLYLHKSSVGSSSANNNSPWNITSASYSSNTTGTCDILFIAWSDNKTSGTVTQAAPGGYTIRGSALSDGTFFNTNLSSADAVASGATGALTGTGTQVGQQAGWACASIALLDGGGGGSTVGRLVGGTLCGGVLVGGLLTGI